jgi:S-phase kinase-associated protein 1
MSKPLILTSSDGIKVSIDEKSASRSTLVKGLLQDYQEEKDIPMPEVRGDVLKKVVEYLIHYKDSEPREIPKPLPSANLVENTDEWDANFINSIDLDTTFDLINTANYMDIKPLLDLSCAKVASVMKNKTAEEIRNMFNIECDLTEEELKEYEEYQI